MKRDRVQLDRIDGHLAPFADVFAEPPRTDVGSATPFERSARAVGLLGGELDRIGETFNLFAEGFELIAEGLVPFAEDLKLLDAEVNLFGEQLNRIVEELNLFDE